MTAHVYEAGNGGVCRGCGMPRENHPRAVLLTDADIHAARVAFSTLRVDIIKRRNRSVSAKRRAQLNADLARYETVAEKFAAVETRTDRAMRERAAVRAASGVQS